MLKIARLLSAVLFLAPVATAAMAGERLVLEPYPGEPAWIEVTNNSVGPQFLWERIPADQEIESYRDILTAQSFPGLQHLAPAQLLLGIIGNVNGACTNVRAAGPTEGEENGIKVAYAQVYCGQQNGRDFGVHMFFKAIQGSDALYMVQREFRVPPSTVGGVQTFSKDQAQAALAMMEAQSVANGYLVNSVYLCGDQTTEAKCAAAGTR